MPDDLASLADEVRAELARHENADAVPEPIDDGNDSAQRYFEQLDYGYDRIALTSKPPVALPVAHVLRSSWRARLWAWWHPKLRRLRLESQKPQLAFSHASPRRMHLLQWQLCQCQACKVITQCSPSNEFYIARLHGVCPTADQPLFCASCFRNQGSTS